MNEVHRLNRDSPRLAIPMALVRVITHLIDELPSQEPSPLRVELRSLRTRLCRLYKLADPADAVSEVEMAQSNAEEDGDEIETLV